MSSQTEDPSGSTLTTPAATPAPYLSSESDHDSSSVSSSTSAHTATPYQPETPPIPAMSATLEEFGTPAQRQAAHVTSILHKTRIKPSLSATNYVAWSDSVRFGLS